MPEITSPEVNPAEFSGCAYVYPNGDMCNWDEWWHFDSPHAFMAQSNKKEHQMEQADINHRFAFHPMLKLVP
jgi:hypothetical protein